MVRAVLFDSKCAIDCSDYRLRVADRLVTVISTAVVVVAVAGLDEQVEAM